MFFKILKYTIALSGIFLMCLCPVIIFGIYDRYPPKQEALNAIFKIIPDYGLYFLLYCLLAYLLNFSFMRYLEKSQKRKELFYLTLFQIIIPILFTIYLSIEFYFNCK